MEQNVEYLAFSPYNVRLINATSPRVSVAVMLGYEGQHNVLMSIWQHQLVEGWLINFLILNCLCIAFSRVFHVCEI